MRLNLFPPPLLVLSAILVFLAFLLLPNPARAITVTVSAPRNDVECLYYLDFTPDTYHPCSEVSEQDWVINPPCYGSQQINPPGVELDEALAILADEPDTLKAINEGQRIYACKVWAKIYSQAGNPSLEEKALALLGAVWEGYFHVSYLEEPLEAFKALEASGQASEALRLKMPLIIGELSRRLGKREEARAIFEKLAKDPAYADKPLYRIVIQYQLERVDYTKEYLLVRDQHGYDMCEQPGPER